MRFTFVLISVLAAANALNVLISSTDSWVLKNTRYLADSLRHDGHKVVLVAPLYNSPAHNADLTDGGDYGHLLPVHQTYYRNLHLMNAPRGAKNVIKKKPEGLVRTESFGQDPMDADAWYVNSDPVSTLLVAFDVVLPNYYAGFVPDVVVLGPNEGLSYTPESSGADVDLLDLTRMVRLSQLKNYTTISVSTEDLHHIYFQDERFFNPQAQHRKAMKKNVFAKNLRFVNKRIGALVNKVSAVPSLFALNVNFPSLNHPESRCFTRKDAHLVNPQFKQVTFEDPSASLTLLKSVVPAYELVDGKLSKNGEYELSYSGPSNDDDTVESTFVDKRSSYYLERLGSELVLALLSDSDKHAIVENPFETAVLNNCQIAVTVSHLTYGNGLGTGLLDLDKMLH